MITFKLNDIDIPEFSKKERLVVVGVIGKSAYRYPNKATPLLPSTKYEENGIECHWDERRGILYLHAITYFDTKQLVTLANELSENSKTIEKEADPSHWLVASGDLASEACRTIALMFHLCHIVVLSSPTPVFDIDYLRLFKAIDAYRTELSPRTVAALASAEAGSPWETHGRACCPRLLFHFQKAPRQLRKSPAALKRLEHAVEDQLYFMLRKARIVTNVCAKSLFAIPKNEEFVYMSTDEELGCARDVSVLVRGLVNLCSGNPRAAPPERATFAHFLQGHVDLAFGEGFDDNVRRYAGTSYFALPSAESWRKAAAALAPVYLESPEHLEDDDEFRGALYDALATDVRFSKARCAKVLPIAQAAYSEGLPSHYSSQQHAHKTRVALAELESMARGPVLGAARAKLRTACAHAWRSRRVCEAPSLTNNPCIEPEHDSTKEHSSGVRYVSACNCGRSKCSRDDPYSVRRANYTFYSHAADECAHCRSLLAHHYPVFAPSTPTYRAAPLAPLASAPPATASDDSSGEWSPDALSPGPATPVTPRTPPATPPPDEQCQLLSLAKDQAEKVMTRQPSTTEYLPGMLHANSPPGLLPAFPSWSLVCLGASSLYSHNIGLPEHLQPGFLPHTNFLLPWDCAVRSDQTSAWRVERPATWVGAGAGRSGRTKHSSSAPHHPLTVKIFIGFEYECPRGHRFMMSSPETVVSGSAASGAAGARLARTDMPLYAACVCRGLVAQLMRVHAVTPKAPVHVTLAPRVRATPGGPVFTPAPSDHPPARLSASAYWVLRLPFVYCDERTPLPRPAAPATLTAPAAQGALLAPLFGLTD